MGGQLPVFSQPGTDRDECVLCLCVCVTGSVVRVAEHVALRVLSTFYDLGSIASNKQSYTDTVGIREKAH